jgi:hypothetical protein
VKYVKQEQLFFKSGINYDDLESEIIRLEKERHSAENEHKLVHERRSWASFLTAMPGLHDEINKPRVGIWTMR